MYPAPTIAIIRRVWAAVTQRPGATLMQLEDQLGLTKSMTWRALRTLRRAGYIDYPDHTRCARTIIVPLYVQELQ